MNVEYDIDPFKSSDRSRIILRGHNMGQMDTHSKHINSIIIFSRLDCPTSLEIL